MTADEARGGPAGGCVPETDEVMRGTTRYKCQKCRIRLLESFTVFNYVVIHTLYGAQSKIYESARITPR